MLSATRFQSLLPATRKAVAAPFATRQLAEGSYEGDFGVVPTWPESTELVIVWTAVPCQTRPVARVSLQNEGLHIDVTPGPNPVEHCAAMAIGYGFRLILLHPVGDRSITARLLDQANQRLVEFP